MIIGKATFEREGKKVELGPGSFNYMPARMCTRRGPRKVRSLFITVDGPWDVNWVEGAPTSADLLQCHSFRV